MRVTRFLLAVSLCFAVSSCAGSCNSLGGGSIGGGTVSEGAVGGGALGGRPSDSAPELLADFPVQPDVWFDAVKEAGSDGADAEITDHGLLGLNASAMTDSPVYDEDCGALAEWNGKPCWDFDGTNDQYQTATQTNDAQPYLVAMLLSRDTSHTTVPHDTIQNFGWIQIQDTVQQRWLMGAYAGITDPRPNETNRVSLYCAIANGASSEGFFSGEYVSGLNMGTTGWNGATLGGTYTQGSDLDGKIGLYVYKDDPITEGLDCWDVAAYAQYAFGVTPRVDRQPTTEVWDDDPPTVQALAGGDYVCDRYNNGGTKICPNSGSCRIMTLGDSTTAWSGTQYQNVVERDLGWGCAATDQQGVSGQNISWLKTNSWDPNASDAYDALVLMTGTNDIRFGTSADDVMTEVNEILSDAAGFGMKTLLMSPPPCTGAASCSSADDAGFDDLRSQMSAAADGSSVYYFDMYEALGDSGDSRALASWCDDGDDLHPDSSCHEWVMAPLVKGFIQGATFTSYGVTFEDAGTKTQALSTSDAVVDMDTAAANKDWTVAGDGTITTDSGGSCYVEADLFVSFASGTPTLTFTIYKEGVATALTDTVVIADTSTHQASLGGTVSCSAADTFDVRVKADSGTPTMTLEKGAIWGRR